MMKLSKTTTALAILLAVAAGCGSRGEVQVDASVDATEHNRLLVRMALAENVYNGNATQRAVYPRDFEHGSAALNPLGVARVRMLIDAYRGGEARIAVLRGEESQDLHARRIDAVRQQFADAGFEQDHVLIGRDGQLDPGSSSGRAMISFDRLMSEYKAKQTGGAPAAAAAPGGMK